MPIPRSHKSGLSASPSFLMFFSLFGADTCRSFRQIECLSHQPYFGAKCCRTDLRLFNPSFW